VPRAAVRDRSSVSCGRRFLPVTSGRECARRIVDVDRAPRQRTDRTAETNEEELHMNRMQITLGIVSVVAALSAGCASTNPDEARMKQHAANVEDISKQWKKGNDLVVEGEKVKAKGNNLVSEGQKQVAEGDTLISRGKTLMAESENAFRDNSKKVGGPVSLAK
jgi:hypothetical protein